MEKLKIARHAITVLICGAGLVFILGFMGGKWSPLFDGWGHSLRQTFDRPIGINSVNTPLSPTSGRQLRIGSKQWTWHDTDRTTTYEAKAVSNGQPFMGGANLDVARNARVFVKWPAEWQNDSVLSFTDDEGSKERASTTLTVDNATGNKIPFVLVYDAVQAHYVFELAPGAPQSFKCPLPTADEPLTVVLPSGTTQRLKIPAGKPASTLAKLKITLKESQAAEAEMEVAP